MQLPRKGVLVNALDLAEAKGRTDNFREVHGIGTRRP